MPRVIILNLQDGSGLIDKGNEVTCVFLGAGVFRADLIQIVFIQGLGRVFEVFPDGIECFHNVVFTNGFSHSS